MNETTHPEVRTRLKAFMEQHGQPVRFNNDDPNDKPNFYGWTDWKADEHTRTHTDNTRSCHWIIQPGATLTEHTYRQFDGTFNDVANEVGVNAAPANCACGKYTNRHLRYTGTLGSILVHILKDDTNGIWL